MSLDRGAFQVAGVDGCPGGWVCVCLPVLANGNADPVNARGELFETFADLLAAQEHASLIAVDIPIGLADKATRGGRACDVAARAVLGARQSAVFAMPSRDAVMSQDYPEACEVALATSDPPRKISKQAFNLFPKIREVDRLMSARLQDTVREVHPEVAFWALNGEQALDTPKKVKSRPNPEGLEQRKRLLERVGFTRSFLDAKPWPSRLCGADDWLDACANAWSAWRIVAGLATCFPEAPELDRRGLRMEIWG